MAVYWILIGVFSLCAVVNCINISTRYKDKLYWGCSASLIILSAVRDFSVGADTLNYCNSFRYISSLSFKQALRSGWEQGYVVLNWWLGHFFKDGRALIVFMALVILIPFFIWIKRESKWPVLSLVIFVCTGMWSSSMFILRQWCAMAILTFSYKYIKQQKFIPFLALVLVAAMFHRTAVIFILAYFILWIPMNTSIVLLAVPVSALIGLFGGRILSFLNQFARIAESGNFNGGIPMLIVLWLCIFAVLVCFKGNVPSQLDFYFRLVFLAAFLQPIAFTFSNWARIVSYFSVSLSVFLPNFVEVLTSDETPNQRFRLSIGCIVCALMFVWFLIIKPEPYIYMQF